MPALAAPVPLATALATLCLVTSCGDDTSREGIGKVKVGEGSKEGRKEDGWLDVWLFNQPNTFRHNALCIANRTSV